MTREEMKARAVELREQGVYLKEIAVYLGVSTTTVVRWTNPKYAEHSRSRNASWKERNRERNRARDREYVMRPENRGVCANPCCENLRGKGQARRGPGYCQECVHACAVARQSIAEGMWADGWTISECAEIIGQTPIPMRARGWDLPHRRTPEQVARIVAGRWH